MRRGRPSSRGRRGVLRRVPLLVGRQVVRPGEGPLAAVALEGLVAGVLAHVPSQLVGAREAPLAQPPRAPGDRHDSFIEIFHQRHDKFFLPFEGFQKVVEDDSGGCPTWFG